MTESDCCAAATRALLLPRSMRDLATEMVVWEVSSRLPNASVTVVVTPRDAQADSLLGDLVAATVDGGDRVVKKYFFPCYVVGHAGEQPDTLKQLLKWVRRELILRTAAEATAGSSVLLESFIAWVDAAGAVVFARCNVIP